MFDRWIVELFDAMGVKDKFNIDTFGVVAFYVALFIEVLIVLVDKSAYINPIEGRLFQLTFALCVLKIVLTKYNLKEWIIIIAFMSLGLFMDQWTDKNEAIRFIAFIAASKDIQGKKAMKMVFYITLAGCVAIVLMSIMGIMGTVYLETDYYRGVGVERRYCLGMGHPNALHCMFWAIATLGIYLYWEKLRWHHYMIIVVLDIGLFLLTNSRIGMIVSLFSIIVGIIVSYHSKIKDSNSIYYLLIVGLFVCVIFSVICAGYDGLGRFEQGYTNKFIDWLDVKLTCRITDSSFTGHITKWSLFSNKDVIGLMDMGYIKLFYRYGIVPATIYVVSIMMLIIRSCKKKDIGAVILISSFLLYNVMEAHIISQYFARNYMLMLLFGVWNEVFFVEIGSSYYLWEFNRLIKK